ncbi:hypothetical protein SO694_00124043 [Aureococcus anophagefferens]|uniref:Uncharacterized protein n=1 Tax=Aureococcus anophagefferens TaxID=44056 RepID=A0ABR1G3J5_AURAN
MEWYQKCVLDPDRLQERNGGRVGLKGFAGNQSLNRQLYVAAGRGDAHGVRRLAASGADVNVRLFQLINHYDGSNGQPSGHGVPLSKYRGRWIDRRGDWNIARWGRAGDPAEMTYASRAPSHEAAQRGSADTVAALPELGASPFSRGEGLRTPEDDANYHRSREPLLAVPFSRCAEMLAAASGGNSATAEEAERWSPPGGVEILRAWYGGPRGHNGKIHDVHAGAPWLWQTTGRRREDAAGKDVTTIVRASLRDGKLRFNEARFCCNDIFGFGQSGGNATRGCHEVLAVEWRMGDGPSSVWVSESLPSEPYALRLPEDGQALGHADLPERAAAASAPVGRFLTTVAAAAPSAPLQSVVVSGSTMGLCDGTYWRDEKGRNLTGAARGTGDDGTQYANTRKGPRGGRWCILREGGRWHLKGGAGVTRYHFDSTDDVPPIGQWLVTTGVGHPAPSVSHTGEVLRDDSARTPVVHERVGGLTYAASEAHAVARGGRLLTLAEARQHMGGKALCPGDDQWCAVAGRDWVQIGDRHHHPGKSHVVDCHHYPPWGDDANNATYGRPTWNAYALYATSGGGGGLDGAWFSFKNGDEANVHDRFEAREAGGRLYRFTRGGAPLDNYAIEGAQLVGGVPSIGTVVPAALFFLYDNLRATVAPGGDILWSHGYTSRREGAPAAERTVGAVVATCAPAQVRRRHPGRPRPAPSPTDSKTTRAASRTAPPSPPSRPTSRCDGWGRPPAATWLGSAKVPHEPPG